MIHDEFFHKFKIPPCEVFYFNSLVENASDGAFEKTAREFLGHGLLRNPYDRCLFIIPLDEVFEIIYCDGEKLTEYGADKQDKLFLNVTRAIDFHGDGYVFDIEDDFSIIHCVCLMMLKMKSTRKEEIEISEVLNNRRKKNKKPPLTKYTTISNPVYSSRDGTHASPMPHWRRGHVRLQGGKIKYIEPVIVNAHKGDPIKREAYKVRK